MSDTASQPLEANPWLDALARAVLAAAFAAVITFTAGHDPRFGMLTFGGYALILGLLSLPLGSRPKLNPRHSGYAWALALVSLAAAIAALGGALLEANGSFYKFLLAAWALVLGVLGLLAYLRQRPRSVTERDGITLAAAAILLGIIFLLIPDGYAQSFSAPGGVTGTVTAPVALVGIFGGYLVIVAVYVGIAAFSYRWASEGKPERNKA